MKSESLCYYTKQCGSNVWEYKQLDTSFRKIKTYITFHPCQMVQVLHNHLKRVMSN